MADPFPKDPEGAVVALVLAGGTGGRLMPLTAARAKPMVPLAGQYRLIDVVLSNSFGFGGTNATLVFGKIHS